MHQNLGDELLHLCAQTTDEIVLVSPFIKYEALEKIFEAIPEQVNIKCVTRWYPEEIAAGVSDLEVFDLMAKRPKACLLLHPFLHAKYFRADHKCILGSANLTKRALGWSSPTNLELMIELSFDVLELKLFEQELLAYAFQASEALRQQIENQAVRIKQENNFIFCHASVDNGSNDVAHDWLPLCPAPGNIYQIYAQKNLDQILNSTLEAGKKDLSIIAAPLGFDQTAFDKYIAAVLQQMPLIQRIYCMTKNHPLTPEAGKALILSFIDQKSIIYKPEQHWDILRKWLLYFLPHTYRQPSGSNDLQVGKLISEFKSL